MNINRNLPYELRQMVETELNDNENLLWAGQPKPGRMAIKSLPIAIFAIPFTAFSVFWMFGASGFKIPDFSQGGFAFFPLFGLPFLFVGLGMFSSPLWRMRAAKRTIYVITDKRAIIFDGGFKTNIRSFTANQLQDLSRKQRRDGSGDIVFKREISYNNQGNNMPVKEIGFLGIDNVKDVEDKIREIG
jgi:hypothetical protein